MIILEMRLLMRQRRVSGGRYGSGREKEGAPRRRRRRRRRRPHKHRPSATTGCRQQQHRHLARTSRSTRLSRLLRRPRLVCGGVTPFSFLRFLEPSGGQTPATCWSDLLIRFPDRGVTASARSRPVLDHGQCSITSRPAPLSPKHASRQHDATANIRRQCRLSPMRRPPAS